MNLNKRYTHRYTYTDLESLLKKEATFYNSLRYYQQAPLEQKELYMHVMQNNNGISYNEVRKITKVLKKNLFVIKYQNVESIEVVQIKKEKVEKSVFISTTDTLFLITDRFKTKEALEIFAQHND